MVYADFYYDMNFWRDMYVHYEYLFFFGFFPFEDWSEEPAILDKLEFGTV